MRGSYLTLHWLNRSDIATSLRLGPIEVIRYKERGSEPKFWRHPQGGSWALGGLLLIIYIRGF